MIIKKINIASPQVIKNVRIFHKTLQTNKQICIIWSAKFRQLSLTKNYKYTEHDRRRSFLTKLTPERNSQPAITSRPDSFRKFEHRT